MKTEINAELIKNFMTKNKISKTRFCRICHISPGTLKKIMNNEKNFNIVALFRIARFMGLKVIELFK